MKNIFTKPSWLKKFLVFLFVNSLFQIAFAQNVKIKNGSVDFGFKHLTKTCNLDGDWEFYWGETPGQVTTLLEEGHKPDILVSVPHYWNKTIEQLAASQPKNPMSQKDEYSKKKVNPRTSGTYRLMIKGLPADADYAMMIKESPGTSCAIYINGNLIIRKGNPFAYFYSTKQKKSMSNLGPAYTRFQPDENGNAEIMIFVTNYFYRKGGLWDSVKIGTVDTVFKEYNFYTGFSLLASGILLFMGILSLIQFLTNKGKKQYLYFAIIAFVLFIRVMVADFSTFNIIFPGLSGEWKKRLEYPVMWVVPLCLIQIMREMYPPQVKYIIFKGLKEPVFRAIFFAIYISLGLASFCLPVKISNYLVPYLKYVIVLAGAYMAAILIINMIKKQPYIYLHLASLLFLTIGTLSDFIFTRTKDFLNISFLPYVLVIFSIIELATLAKKHRDITHNEYLNSLKLKKINDAYGKYVPAEFIQLFNKKSLESVKAGESERINGYFICGKIRVKERDVTFTPEIRYCLFSSYLKEIKPIIERYKGIICDIQNGLFVAFLPVSANEAVNAVLEIANNNQALYITYNEKTYSVETRAAVHDGQILAGLVQDNEKLNKTIISEGINTTIKIESLCEKMNKGIIISENVKRSLTTDNSYELFEIETVSMKIKQKTTKLFDCIPEY